MFFHHTDIFPPGVGSNFAIQGVSSLRRLHCAVTDTSIAVLKLLLAAIYTNFSTTIVEDGGMEQADAFISGPVGNKLIVQFQRVEAENETGGQMHVSG